MITDIDRKNLSCTVKEEGLDEAIRQGFKKIKFITRDGISTELKISDTILHPIWDRILYECREKIEEKFKEYGNSWKEKTGISVDDKFWKPRLEQEVKEVFEKFGTDRMPELIDVINVCAMIYTLEAEIWADWTRSER